MYIAPLTRQSLRYFCAEGAIFRRCVRFATVAIFQACPMQKSEANCRAQPVVPSENSIQDPWRTAQAGHRGRAVHGFDYMVPRRDRPLQTWKTFICNHM